MTEDRQNDYSICTNKDRLDVDLIHDYLSRTSYWAMGRSLAVVQTSIENSLCFGVYAAEQQVGFARVVTDGATFAWLCDVFILAPYRGQGLGKRLVETIVAHPVLQNLDIFLLATRDAHELYRRQGGFEDLPVPGKWMVRSHH